MENLQNDSSDKFEKLLADISSKSQTFAVRIIKMCRYINENNREFQLTAQVKRSGTNIGASIVKAEVAPTRSDKFSKISVSLKEAKETEYWLKLLWEANCLTEEQYMSISHDCYELSELLILAMRFKENK